MTGGRHHGGRIDSNRHGGGRDGRRYRNRSLERRFDDSGSSHRPHHGGRRPDDDDRQPSQRRRRVDDAYFRDEDLEGRRDRHGGYAIGRRHGERRDGGRRRDSDGFEEAFDSNRDWRRNESSHRGGHRDRRHPPTDDNRRGGEDRRHFREDPPLHGHGRLDSRRPPSSYGKRSRQVASLSPLRADNPRDASSLRHSRSPDSVASNASSIHHYRYDCGGQSSSFKVKAEDSRGGSSLLPQQEEMPPSYEEFARKHQSRVFTYLNDCVLPIPHPVSTAAAEEQQRTDGILAAAPEVPPDSIVRVALYGVDLSVTSAHLNSMAEQVLGAAPWRVRRPALEVLASLAGSDGANLMGSSTAAAGASGQEAAKAIAPQPGCDAVLMEGYIGEETQGIPVGQRHDAVIPDPSGGGSSSAANPFLFMPGLRDVSGAGGMVVLEFIAAEVATKALKLFNGATINGRHIVASM